VDVDTVAPRGCCWSKFGFWLRLSNAPTPERDVARFRLKSCYVAGPTKTRPRSESTLAIPTFHRPLLRPVSCQHTPRTLDSRKSTR
jgi:hypothetical protein